MKRVIIELDEDATKKPKVTFEGPWLSSEVSRLHKATILAYRSYLNQLRKDNLKKELDEKEEEDGG